MELSAFHLLLALLLLALLLYYYCLEQAVCVCVMHQGGPEV